MDPSRRTELLGLADALSEDQARILTTIAKGMIAWPDDIGSVASKLATAVEDCGRWGGASEIYPADGRIRFPSGRKVEVSWATIEDFFTLRDCRYCRQPLNVRFTVEGGGSWRRATYYCHEHGDQLVPITFIAPYKREVDLIDRKR